MNDLSRAGLARAVGPAAFADEAYRLARIGAFECELATERLTWTDAVYDLFGLSPGAPLNRAAITHLYTDASRRGMEALRAQAIRTGRGGAMDAEIRTCRGERRWMRLSIASDARDGRASRVFGVKQDITDERAAWDRLRRLAEHDHMTGLANRASFDARYRAMIEDGETSALVLVDLDHFKRINDGLGHAAGDACLREIAARLARVFAGARLVARIGGDEFAVLLPTQFGASRIRHLLTRASEALGQPVVWGDMAVAAGASIGAAILGRLHLRTPSEIFGDADEALFAAKHAGRGRVHVFGDEPEQTKLMLGARRIARPQVKEKWEVGQRPARSR